jgi:hypothetical protein
MDTGQLKMPPNQATSLEEGPKPMLVVFHGTKRIAAPDGAILEVVLFKVWEPDDWTDPTNPDRGSHMVGKNYQGESEPVLLTSIPIVVKEPPPQPSILRGAPLSPRNRIPRA